MSDPRSQHVVVMKTIQEDRNQKAVVSSQKLAASGPGWWEKLPAGEKYLLRMVVGHLRKAKADPTMAAAAAKWETRLICFIKFRLVGQAARSQRATQRRPSCRV